MVTAARAVAHKTEARAGQARASKSVFNSNTINSHLGGRTQRLTYVPDIIATHWLRLNDAGEIL